MSNALSRQYFCQKHRRLVRFEECVASDCRFVLGSSCRNDAFTEREYIVLKMLCQGIERTELHNTLIVGRKTVTAHVNSMLRKMDAHSVAALVAKAFNEGWVKPECEEKK